PVVVALALAVTTRCSTDQECEQKHSGCQRHGKKAQRLESHCCSPLLRGIAEGGLTSLPVSQSLGRRNSAERRSRLSVIEDHLPWLDGGRSGPATELDTDYRSDLRSGLAAQFWYGSRWPGSRC